MRQSKVYLHTTGRPTFIQLSDSNKDKKFYKQLGQKERLRGLKSMEKVSASGHPVYPYPIG